MLFKLIVSSKYFLFNFYVSNEWPEIIDRTINYYRWFDQIFTNTTSIFHCWSQKDEINKKQTTWRGRRKTKLIYEFFICNFDFTNKKVIVILNGRHEFVKSQFRHFYLSNPKVDFFYYFDTGDSFLKTYMIKTSTEREYFESQKKERKFFGLTTVIKQWSNLCQSV